MVDGIRTLTICLGSIAAFVLVFPLEALAQEAKPARIGFFRLTQPPTANMAAFHKGMRDRGHIEGKTYVLVPGWRKPGGKKEKGTVLAKKLVARGVDIIVTVGSRSARVASRAAPSTPIVMASSADPVRAGLIKSLAKPGGNITGMSSATVDATVKRMEILKQLVPGLRRVGAIHRGSSRTSSKLWSAASKNVAKLLGIEIIRLDMKKTESYDALLARAVAAGVGAISVRSIPSFTTAQRKRLMDAVLKAKLPNMQLTKTMATLGGLVSFGTKRAWLYRRAAAYVDLILKGAKPADLPVEQASQFEFVINLKTAKALGITIPTALLLRADEVIE